MKAFDLLPLLIGRARTSPFWLWVLNRLLGRVIPFNRPHGFSLVEIGEDTIRTSASYKRVNYNHVRGIHACAIATVAEFSAGFLLLTKLDPGRYRLIMSHLEIAYHYQAKHHIVSESTLSLAQLEQDILEPLKTEDVATIRMRSRVSDAAGNEIAVGWTTWQIKRWEQVKTRV